MLSLLCFLSFLYHALAAPENSESNTCPPRVYHIADLLSEAPSAASFYVPSIPGIHQDPDRPLTLYAGHLSSEYNFTLLNSNQVTPHLFFILVKNRRTADKERIVFWFNASPPLVKTYLSLPYQSPSGRTWVLIIRWSHDGGWPMANRWKRRIPGPGRWMGRVYHDGFWSAHLSSFSNV